MWAVAIDPEEVHALICACDAYNASPRAPAPVRTMESTIRRVAEGSVHVFRDPVSVAASFTLSWTAPYDADAVPFTPAVKPAYISRVAVRPDLLAQGSLLGLQCYREAFAVAAEAGADVIRAEANPDLERVFAMLHMLQFVQVGGIHDDGVRRFTYLERPLEGLRTERQT